MSDRAVSSDRVQQARDNIASRRQSGLEPRPEDLRDAQLEESRPRRFSKKTKADDGGET